MKKFLAIALAILMIVSVLPLSVMASDFDTSVSGDYYKVISENKYNLAPGATETELIVNNAEGTDRKVVHYFEVDTKNENIEVLPGYYGIDKLDPDNLALDGVADKTKFWKAEQLTKTVAYYENMGYNVVGAMNTALAYDSNAPYGYMVWNGVVLGSPEVHKGAKTYLAIDAEGNCELRSMTTPLNGTEVTAISANFDWLVKDGVLTSKSVERTSSDASRSMIGIKADGTLIFCQVDGRNAPLSTGLSNYEMGEMMLSLGCVNAVNCDGGGSSTFVSKREGESENVMRSIPSDGSERATINSVIIVSKAKSTGEFDHAVLDTEYDYYAPTTSATMIIKGVDATGSPAKLPEEGISWALSDDSFGTVANGVFTSNGTKGDVAVKMLYNGEVVGEKLIHVVDPDVFAFTLDETVLPYGKNMTIDLACKYGVDNWAVCVEGAYTLALSDASAATLNGNLLVAPNDESIKGVDVVATYLPNPLVTDMLKVTYGKGSEVIWDFEDGLNGGFVGFDEAKQYSIDNGINNTLVGDSPLAGQFNSQMDSETFITNSIVKNGKYALAWSLDNTDADFAGWSYNVLFNIGECIVFRDVENGKNATAIGMWLYIPEGAAGLAFQAQFFVRNSKGTTGCGQMDFKFTTVSGAVKNLNSCTEADIPESRWVYASADISGYVYVSTMDPNTTASNGRSPSFVRTYIKPMVPAVHTFYIDDITLDYSSAVDDRVLPTITDTAYTTQDESVALANGATIDGNNVAFSATVADNIKLDNATAKIYVDGNELSNVTVSGKYLASEKVALLSGAHTVKFEIKDTLGNTAVAIRNFTIAGDAPVVLGGHNDSGAKPEYDSVYYADINVADITNINKLSVSILLQDANTWEPQGMVVANGFSATYTLDKVESILTVYLERNGDEIDASATTILSAPIRLWSWDAINHVTGEPITPQTQYATGYCPVVAVDYRVVKSEVEFVDGEGSFGGKMSVETMINDIVHPWHYHDDELVAIEDVEATCTTNGHTGRTYCATCQSVINWGTIEAKGHNYVAIDGKFVCEHCGDEKTTTGLVEIDGNTYYFINGKAATGWQMIGTDWYYFDPATAVGVNGDLTLEIVTYNFVNGKMTSGVWVKTLYGMKYYDGPNPQREGWLNIDGKDYYFNDYYMLHGGYQIVLENSRLGNCYYFNEDGSCDKNAVIPDGFVTDRNGLAYVKDGRAINGLHYIDGDLYYFRPYQGYAAKNGEYVGYLFGDDCKAVNGLIEKNGKYYYYEDGKPKMAGLIEVDGAYYFAYDGKGTCATGVQYVWESNGIIENSNREFGADGKMLDGIVEKDGKYYYYNMGKPEMAGLIEVDGAYYFVYDSKGTCATGTTYIWKSNGIIESSNREFGADGKMLDGIVEKDGKYYYYNMGKPEMAGLIEVDGAYYFAYDSKGTCVVGCKEYVWKSNGILPNSDREFGADGKMLDGIVEKDGNYYYYNMGKPEMAGLIEVDGAYYFAYDSKGTCVVGRKEYMWKANGILPNSDREFGADGKMLDGIVEKDGKYYYYNMGKPEMAGLIEVDGAYYFAYDSKGTCVAGRKEYVWASNGIIPNSDREFGADGKMLDGIVEKDGKYYYYEMGKPVMAGLIEVDGTYYFVYDNKGSCATGLTYVWESNGLMENGNYYFDAEGKMLDGFVTKDDGIYYYENGKAGKVGINYIDGYYYFIDYGAKVITNKKLYYVWETNGYTVKMVYNFDALGRVIL